MKRMSSGSWLRIKNIKGRFTTKSSVSLSHMNCTTTVAFHVDFHECLWSTSEAMRPFFVLTPESLATGEKRSFIAMALNASFRFTVCSNLDFGR